MPSPDYATVYVALDPAEEARIRGFVASATEQLKAEIDRLRSLDTARCGTCKHWLPAETVYDRPTMYGDDSTSLVDGELEPIMAPGWWGTCERAALLGPRDSSDRFYAKDASGYRAWLGTREDFGCVEHQPKEMP